MGAYTGFGRRAQTRMNVQFATRAHHTLINKELERRVAHLKPFARAHRMEGGGRAGAMAAFPQPLDSFLLGERP